jgi:phage tail sheath gpL-like
LFNIISVENYFNHTIFTMSSNAVGAERISKIVGYKITKGNFSQSTPNLPQRIAIFAEANEVNQGTLDTNGREITSAQQAGQLYGFGSPAYNIMRILRPLSGGGVGGVPTIVYAQAKAVGATSKILKITPTGTATGNGTHTLVIAGRQGIDGVFYDVNIEEGDNAAVITGKIEDAVNAVLGAPVIAISYDYDVRLESKWKGLTANDLSVTVETNDNDLGITYAVVSQQSGSGTPSISAALAQFGNDWNTIVINSYGTHSGTMDTLEAFNGIPDPDSPTGRYSGIIMKPFIALTGSVADNPSGVTDARLEDVTIAICPAPLSAGLAMEAAANMAFLYARQAQDSPHLDVSGMSYPDMPVPTNIGSMADYENRDAFVKKGCSTVILNAGRYEVQDFVTTYHPLGETPPQFRYVRNLNIDFNVRYGYYLLELINVVDHAIANDNDTVSATKVVKPKQWRGILDAYADDLASRALIVESTFMQDSIEVTLSTTNPDRMETFFRYKRSGFSRIASTTAEAGFNFGTVN